MKIRVFLEAEGESFPPGVDVGARLFMNGLHWRVVEKRLIDPLVTAAMDIAEDDMKTDCRNCGGHGYLRSESGVCPACRGDGFEDL